jgi:hypothetical protein
MKKAVLLNDVITGLCSFQSLQYYQNSDVESMLTAVCLQLFIEIKVHDHYIFEV